MSINNTDDFRSCDAQWEFSSSFQPSPFRRNSAVQNMHSNPPRFGHISDINLLIQGTKSQQKDYLTGLLAVSFAIFCLFFVWVVLLLFLKCLGPDRVGFLSARRKLPVKPTKPEVVYRHERIRNKHPFQHNGQAGTGTAAGGGCGSPKRSGATKKILQPMVGVAKAPLTVVTKARQRKRELERRSQFERMDEEGGGVNDDDEEKLDDDDTTNKQSNTGSSDALELEPDDAREHAPSPDGNTGESSSSSEVLTEADRQIIRQFEQDWKQYEQQIHRGQDRIRRIRIGAGFCAISIMISALLFTIMTQDSFTTSLDLFGSGLQNVDALIDQALTTSNDFIERQANAQNSTTKFILQINEICPDSTEQLCTNINDETATTLEERGCDFSSLPYGTELTNVVNTFDETLAKVLENIADSQQDLLTMKDLVYQANLYYPKHGKQVFWASVGTSLALGVVALMLTGGMVYIELGQGQQANGRERKLPKVFACCRSWLLVPLLLLLVCISWILSMSFILMGIGSADLCYNSPDNPVLNALETMQEEFDSLVYLFIIYYISGCPASDAPIELEVAIQAIQETVLPAMGNLVEEIQAQGQENLEAVCGTGLAPLLAILEALGSQLCILAQTMADLRALLSCENWYPLYRMTMHDAVCQYATQGFIWATATQTVIVLLALVLLTLRVSFFDLEEVLQDEDAPSGGCCVCLCASKPPPKDEHIGEITVTQPKVTPAQSDKGSCFGCFGSKQAPKDKHIGEISITKQAAPTPIANDTAASIPVAALPTIEEVPPPTSNKDSYAIEYSSSDSSASAASKKDTYEIENSASDGSDSYESGSIEEASLKG